MNRRTPQHRPLARGIARVSVIGLIATALLGLPGVAAAAPSTDACAVWERGTSTTYASLQSALDASSPGVTLFVKGTCVGSTTVSIDATIRGASKKKSGRATLDGNLVAPVLQITAGATLRLEGMIVTRGFLQAPSPGGGIFNEGVLVLKNSIVSESTGQRGGGIANFGDATILDSIIDHNGLYEGGNIYNAGTLVVRDTEITRGVGRFGQGLWNGQGATATLVRSSVTDSDPALPFSGGGIENHGVLTLIHSEVSRNLSLQGGGILNDGTAYLIRSKVTDNVGDQVGGGILNGPAFFPGGGQQLFLIGTEVSNNQGAFGGGVYNKGVLTVQGHTRIGGNTAAASGQGGGIYNDPGASLVGVTPRTFKPPNVPDQCVGCP